MEWRDTPEQAAWRAEVRSFLSEHLAPELRQENRFDRPPADVYERWRQALTDRGWIAPAWPKAYGGAGLSPVEQFIVNYEMAEARAPLGGTIGVHLLGPTLIVHGTEEQRRRHLPGLLSDTVRWCQGYSEPSAGSDLASLQTRAVRDGDDFVVNGQKIWTSLAHEADWCFCLVRTDPGAPKHRGITYLLIDMKTPGITVRPLRNMANQRHFNEVFFDDVRVPADNVVGEVNRGWYVTTTTLDFERSSIGGSVGQRQEIERFVRWLREHREEMPATTYAASRLGWVDRWIEVVVAIQFAYRIISMQAAGQIPNYEASMAKLFNSELVQQVARTAHKMLGTAGVVRDPRDQFGYMRGIAYLRTVSATIAGGTSEVQRNIIATRGLGLPRG